MKKLFKKLKEHFTFNAFKHVMMLIKVSVRDYVVVRWLYFALVLMSCLALFTNIDSSAMVPGLSFIVFVYVLTAVNSDLIINKLKK